MSSDGDDSSPQSKKKSKNKRRFNDEQIRSLESMFERETKLESRKKMQVAKELGLQPRQVSIWFQNKRARWKSKQIEKDSSILQDNYDALASKFEALKREKQSLLLQLQKLNQQLQRPQEQSQVPHASSGNGKPGYYKIDEEEIFLNMVEPADSSLTSSDDWCSFSAEGLFDESSHNDQWWNYWS